MNEKVETFITKVERASGLWKSVDVRTLAAFADGAWRNLVTQIYLRSAPTAEVPTVNDVPAWATLRVLQTVSPVTQLQQLLDNFSSGGAAVGNVDVYFRTSQFEPDGGQEFQFTDYRVRRIEQTWRPRHVGLRWGGYELSGYGDSCDDIIRRVDGGLASLEETVRDTPEAAGSLAAIADYVLGINTNLTSGRISSVEVFAPLEARIDETTERVGGAIDFVLRAGSLAAADHVSLTATSRPLLGAATHRRLQLSAPDWSDFDGGLIATGRMPGPSGPETMLTLSVANQVVQRRLWPGGYGAVPAALVAYQRYDEKLSVLRAWLRAKDSKRGNGHTRGDRQIQRRFEYAVARVLTFVGLRADVLAGDDRFDNAVDILAYHSARGTCLAIECTIDAVDVKGKLSKLAARTGELSEALSHANVRAIIATALSNSQIIDADLDTAARNSIAVLDAEALDQLLALAEGGGTPNDAMELIDGFVPSRGLNS